MQAITAVKQCSQQPDMVQEQAATFPSTTCSSTLSYLFRGKSVTVTIGGKGLDEVVRGKVASDHG